MDKQIVFYSDQYQFYYSPKNKTISAPQISGKQNKGYVKNWFICFSLAVVFWVASFAIAPILTLSESIVYGAVSIILMYILARIFLKAKIYFEFSLKVIWYVFFVLFFFAVGFAIAIGVAMGGVITKRIEIVAIMAVYILVYIFIGTVLTCKKSINVTGSEEFIDTFENRKMLCDVLITNDVNYKRIIIFEVILCVICFFCSMAYSWLVFFTALPVFIVAVFQRNIYYLFLIRKIAKQYGISLKSKDVLEENDAEAEKQINAENKANEEHGTNTKNISTTENEMNAEINTADDTSTPKDTSTEIITENKANQKNDVSTNTSTEN